MIKKWLVAVMLSILVWLPAHANANNEPLPAAKAFHFEAQLDKKSPGTFLLQWQMAPNYFLYRDSVKVIMDGKPVNLQLPPALFKKDVENGEEAIYSDQLHLAVSYQQAAHIMQLMVKYQGCAKSGFCYPPVTKHYQVNTQAQQLTLIGKEQNKPNALNAFLTDQNHTKETLGNRHFIVSLFIFLGLGVLLAFTPCVLPMVPILVSIIAGHKQRLTTKTTNKHVFTLCLAYVLGVAMTYAMVGVFAAMLGSSIQVWLQKPLFIVMGGLIFLVLGLSLFGLFELYLFKGMQNAIASWTRHLQGGSHITVFCMGVLSVLLISPCTTAPLIGVLLYIGQTGNMLLGASTLFVMGLGMGVPLLMVGMSADKWLPRRGPWMEWVKKFFGVMMIGMAVWMVGRTGIIHFTNTPVTLAAEQQFMPVNSVQEFEKQVAVASQSNRTIILDFYASWCESCVSMEKEVFNNPSVSAVLSPFTMLRIDLSANTATDELLMKHFNVIAPPAVLFFDEQGQEVDSKRIVGEVNASEFIRRIDTFVEAGCSKNATC